MTSLTQTVFHLICRRNAAKPADYDERYFQGGFAEAEAFFRRFAGHVDYRGKKVLDVGCGYGAACLHMALRGAREVWGVDIDAHRIDFARAKLAGPFHELASRVRFEAIRGLGDLGSERFEIITSQNSFEHIADPEGFVREVRGYLAPGGLLVIGFGPLWRSPYGGHISFMTPVPWAHLLFPEPVIMAERKRFRPEEDAQSFSEIVGGLNKMTLARFRRIMRDSGLECIYWRVNATEKKGAVLARLLSRLPVVGELFAFNVYGVWRG